MARRPAQQNPLVRVSPVHTPFDPRPYREGDPIIEERWRTVWAPRFKIPVVFSGKARFDAMAAKTKGVRRVKRTSAK